MRAPRKVLFREDSDPHARCPKELANRSGLDWAAGGRRSERFGCPPLRAEEFHTETGKIDCRAAFPGPESDKGPGLLLRWSDRRVDIRTVKNRRFARRCPNIGFCIQGETPGRAAGWKTDECDDRAEIGRASCRERV